MTTLAPLGPSKVRERQPLIWRVQRWVSNWTPLALMALLALFSTWLVKQTPLPDCETRRKETCGLFASPFDSTCGS